MLITGNEVHSPEVKKSYVVPRELRDDELPDIITGFKKATQNAQVAGFDGVEVHCANSYLLDELLRDGTNKRAGYYGGLIENRTWLMFEVIGTVGFVQDSDQVGLRISPPYISTNILIVNIFFIYKAIGLTIRLTMMFRVSCSVRAEP